MVFWTIIIHHSVILRENDWWTVRLGLPDMFLLILGTLVNIPNHAQLAWVGHFLPDNHNISLTSDNTLVKYLAINKLAEKRLQPAGRSFVPPTCEIEFTITTFNIVLFYLVTKCMYVCKLCMSVVDIIASWLTNQRRFVCLHVVAAARSLLEVALEYRTLLSVVFNTMIPYVHICCKEWPMIQQWQWNNTCVSNYTSKCHLQRYYKHILEQQRRNMELPPKRRSQQPHFDFRCNWLICGDECLPVDPKYLDRWRSISQCKTIDVKQSILQVCEERGDE